MLTIEIQAIGTCILMSQANVPWIMYMLSTFTKVNVLFNIPVRLKFCIFNETCTLFIDVLYKNVKLNLIHVTIIVHDVTILITDFPGRSARNCDVID